MTEKISIDVPKPIRAIALLSILLFALLLLSPLITIFWPGFSNKFPVTLFAYSSFIIFGIGVLPFFAYPFLLNFKRKKEGKNAVSYNKAVGKYIEEYSFIETQLIHILVLAGCIMSITMGILLCSIYLF